VRWVSSTCRCTVLTGSLYTSRHSCPLGGGPGGMLTNANVSGSLVRLKKPGMVARLVGFKGHSISALFLLLGYKGALSPVTRLPRASKLLEFLVSRTGPRRPDAEPLDAAYYSCFVPAIASVDACYWVGRFPAISLLSRLLCVCYWVEAEKRVCSASECCSAWWQEVRRSFMESMRQGRDGTIFAAMKKALFLGACLVGLASQPVMAQTSGPDVVVVRVYEYSSRLQITVSRGEGKTEMIQAKGGYQNQASSGEVLQKVLLGLYQQGYMLKGSVTTDAGGIGTFVFGKGQ
jgi:hypothetical protein